MTRLERMKRHFIFFTLHTSHFTLLCMVLYLSGCRTPGAPPISQPGTDTPDQEAWNTTIYLVEDSLQRAVVKAGHRRHYRSSGQTVVDQGLYAEFFDETGKQTATLNAREGVIDESSHNMLVMGEVVVNSAEHGVLKTDSLRWIEAERKIVTDAPVWIATAKDTLTGEGFEGETSSKRWKILRNVKGLFDREDEASESLNEEEKP